MEFLLGLFTGYFMTWPGLLILCILASLAESNESHGIAIFFGLIASVTAYFFFGIPIQVIGFYILGYFLIGFVWSFWRYKRYADKIVADNLNSSEATKKWALKEIKPSAMLGKITTWVIIWPFSMIENVLGDVIQLVQTTVSTFFKSIYTRIYMNAVGKLITETKENNGS